MTRPVWLDPENTDGKWDHARVPCRLFDDQRITALDIGVYAALARHGNTTTGACYPNMKTLRSHIGLNRMTIRRSVERLIEAGYVDVVREKGRSNMYFLLPPGGYPQGLPNSPTPNSDGGSGLPDSRPPGYQVAEGMATESPRGGLRDSHKREPLEQDQENKTMEQNVETSKEEAFERIAAMRHGTQ